MTLQKKNYKYTIHMLRFCPASDYYGSTTDALKLEFSNRQAKAEAVKVVCAWNDVLGMSEISEKCNESSRNSNGSGKVVDGSPVVVMHQQA